ncbi:MAG: hypothetical protein V8T17_10005, partial [Oscillospiraceae bacterium]
NVGMQSEREPEEVSRLSRQRLFYRRRGCQFAIPQHIQIAQKNGCFHCTDIILPMPAKSSISNTSLDTPSSSGSILFFA